MSGFAMALIFTVLFSVFVASSMGLFIVEDEKKAEEHYASLNEHSRIFDERHANITLKKIVYTGGSIEVTLENTGSVVLDPDYVLVTLDSQWLSETEYSVSLLQSPSSGYWEPAEELLIEFTQSLEPGWHTLKVITGKGAYAERRIYLPYAAMMAYYDSSGPSAWPQSTIPRYRLWNGSSWSSEKLALSVGEEIRWIVLKAAPTRNEYALITLDDNGDINGQVWQNGSWLGPSEIITGIDSRYRAFDIAYEQVSGDALMVYGDGTSLPKYLVWDGKSITQTGSVLPIGTGVPRWIVLAPNPGSDEIVLMTLDTNRDIYAQVWDGSNWGNQILLENNAQTSTRQDFDAAYEYQSNRALVAWAERGNNRPQYRIWNGGWNSEASAINGVGNIRWVKLASDPSSNKILMGTLTRAGNRNRLAVQIWDGSSWGNWSEVDNSVERSNRRDFDVAWEGYTGKGLVVYGDRNINYPVYWNWSSAAGWTGPYSSSPNIGDQSWITLRPDPFSNDIMLLAAEHEGADTLNFWRGNASSFADYLEVESQFTTDDYERYDMAYRVFNPGGYAWD